MGSRVVRRRLEAERGRANPPSRMPEIPPRPCLCQSLLTQHVQGLRRGGDMRARPPTQQVQGLQSRAKRGACSALRAAGCSVIDNISDIATNLRSKPLRLDL